MEVNAAIQDERAVKFDVRTGTQDSVKILFAAKDASRWASFDSINAITCVKITILRHVSHPTHWLIST